MTTIPETQDELPSEEFFYSIRAAEIPIEKWRFEYNKCIGLQVSSSQGGH